MPQDSTSAAGLLVKPPPVGSSSSPSPRALVSSSALLLLVGAALPLRFGWGLPVALIGIAAVITWWRDRVSGPCTAQRLGAARFVAVGLAVLSASVFVAVAGAVTGGLFVAFPGAIFVVPVVLVGIVAGAFVRGRARMLVAASLAVLVPFAGMYGARHEAAGSNARGWTHTGPIHGIHPFQITAVLIDGYGPFDIPFNDYVEPSGERGYDPTAYADAMQRALHDIAEVHFAQGPARAYRAFSQAEVEAVVTPAVEETMGVDPGRAEHPRLIVRSGSWGQGSRVEFVCPGKHDNPKGVPPDNLMNRMCPSKYAAEGSAGLGVTGRWPGYVEFRGMERTGLAPWTAQTRTDDEAGRRVRDGERRWTAWGFLALGLMFLARPKTREAIREGVPTFVAPLVILGLILAAVLGLSGDRGPLAAVNFVEQAPPWKGAGWVAWVPLAALLGGLPVLSMADTTSHPEPRVRAGRLGLGWTVAALSVATLSAALVVTRLGWIDPTLIVGVDSMQQPLERWVVAAADTLASRRDLDVFEAEHAIAASLAAVLIAFVLFALNRVGRFAFEVIDLDPPRRERSRWIGGLAVVGLAASLVISRKTWGGAALIPGALGLSVVLHCGVAYVRGPSRARAVLLFAAILGAMVCVVATLDRVPEPDHVYVLAWVAACLASAGASLLFLRTSKPATTPSDAA